MILIVMYKISRIFDESSLIPSQSPELELIIKNPCRKGREIRGLMFFIILL